MGGMGGVYQAVLSERKAWPSSEGNRKDAANVSASVLVQSVGCCLVNIKGRLGHKKAEYSEIDLRGVT